MKFILGTKQNMTQIFKDDGTAVAVTRVKAGPCFVTQIKDQKKDGYLSVQIGFGETKKHRLSKPQAGHLKKSKKLLKTLHEFRITNSDKEQEDSKKVGETITVSAFEEGDTVQITGVSKGKGFQGVVKRHGFSGGPASHGHKDQLRMPGSIGATDAARVFKGKPMAGHMGSEQITVKNLKIVKIDKDEGTLYITGAVPGGPGTVLKIASR